MCYCVLVVQLVGSGLGFMAYMQKKDRINRRREDISGIAANAVVPGGMETEEAVCESTLKPEYKISMNSPG